MSLKIRGCCLILLFFVLYPTISISQINPGIVQTHKADDTILYDWFSYVPKSINKSQQNFILVSIAGGLFDYSENTEQVRLYTEAIKGLAEAYRLILLVPSIPRTNTPTDIYTIAFDRQSFLDTTDPLYTRPDLKINQMIESLSDQLKNEGYQVNEKVFVEGFSAGGMFAQRYCLIHPRRVQGVAAGQCGGSLTLPLCRYGEVPLTWAIGLSDFKELVGTEFNHSAYRQVPQFIYIGDNDNTNSHFAWPNPDGFWTQAQIDFINGIYGDTDPVRVENMANHMKDIGCNVTFKSYLDTGHEIMPWNTPHVYDDIYGFLNKHKSLISDEKDSWIKLSGSVSYNDSPVCAMLLANGQYMFTCKDGDDFGKFEISVPLDSNCKITVQAFVSGIAPFRQTTDESDLDIDIDMQTADPESQSPDVTTATIADVSTPSGWARITGTVDYGGSPICAMVLANGQYMFSCGANGGLYDLTVPLDGNGQITLYVFAAGFQPYKYTFTP